MMLQVTLRCEHDEEIFCGYDGKRQKLLDYRLR
jgi:hypothetical protein